MSTTYTGQGQHAKATTLPSIREEMFHRTLLQRSMHDTNLESTPLRGFDELPMPNSSSNSQDNSNVDGIGIGVGAVENAIAPSKNGKYVPIEAKELALVGSLKDITEVQENISDTPSQDNANKMVAISSQPDGYSRDWYEVLRTRNINLKYINGYSTKAKRRKKVRNVRTTSTIALPPQSEDDIHMEDLADILPLPPESLQQHAHLHKSPLVVKSVAEVGLNEEFPPVQNQLLSDNGVVDMEVDNALLQSQEEHNNFLLENIESITTIMDNLANWHHMLTEYKRSYVAAAGSGLVSVDSLLSATYTYDFDILLQADRRRLQVKLSLLQEIIRNVTFDLSKLPTLQNRMDVAIAYSFLLELKSANIIRLSSNGHFVALN